MDYKDGGNDTQRLQPVHGLGEDFVRDPFFSVILDVSGDIQMTHARWTLYKVASIQEIVQLLLLQMQVKPFQD